MKKKYIKLIRKTIISENFLIQYLLKMIVIYLLSKNVTNWIAVSVPVVIELAQIFIRISKKVIQLTLKLNFKKFFYVYIISLIICGFGLSISRTIFSIYLFSIIIGCLGGLFNSCITRINTQISEFESACFVEQERSQIIGSILGLLISQIFYDINPILYILGIFIFGIFFIILNINLQNISSTEDNMKSQTTNIQLNSKEKNNLIIIGIIYGLIATLWCMGLNAFNELLPLITNKIGYFFSIYCAIEIIAIIIINENVIENFEKNGKLFFWEIICALCDISYLFFVSLFPNTLTISISMFLCGISSTLGDPIYGKIISTYSQNNREKYLILYNTFFRVRAIGVIISLIVCKFFVLKGISSFKYLAIILFITIFILYIIICKLNKKLFNKSI